MWDNLASEKDAPVAKQMSELLVEFKKNNVMVATRPEFVKEAYEFYKDKTAILVEKINKEFD